ncbi:MAG: PAS domain S-box protein, partial [Methanobacteriota archaeon]
PLMNGLELLKELRSFDSDIPFILFSGRGREAVVIEAINTGADFYIQKGGDAKSLFAELNHKVDYAISKRNSRLALKRRDAILEAVSLVATLFLGGEVFNRALAESITLFGLATEVDRVLIFRHEKDDAGDLSFRCICGWNRNGELEVPKNCVFPSGSLFLGEDMILQGESIVGSAELFSDRSHKFLHNQEIISLAAFPVIAGREVRGMIWFCDCLTEREWAVVEIDALQAAASIIGSAICQDEMRSELVSGKEKYASMYSMMHQLCDTVPDMLWAKDPEGRYIFVNRETSVRLLGCSDSDIPLGKKENEFIEAAQVSNPNIADDVHDGETSEIRIPRKILNDRFEESRMINGQPLHLDIRKVPFYDQNGGLIGTISVGRDVTAEREKEQLFRIERKKYANIFHQVHIGLITCLPSGEVSDINRRAAELLGRGSEEMQGMNLHTISGLGDTGLLRDFSAAQTLKIPIHGKSEYRDKKGNVRDLYYGVQPYLDETSHVMEVLITIDMHYQD